MADAKTGIEHFYITKSPDIHGGEPNKHNTILKG